MRLQWWFPPILILLFSQHPRQGEARGHSFARPRHLVDNYDVFFAPCFCVKRYDTHTACFGFAHAMTCWHCIRKGFGDASKNRDTLLRFAFLNCASCRTETPEENPYEGKNCPKRSPGVPHDRASESLLYKCAFSESEVRLLLWGVKFAVKPA